MRYLRQEHILNRLINLHLIFGIDLVGTGPSTGDVAPPVSHSRFTEQRQFPFHATTVAVLRWQYVAKASLWFWHNRCAHKIVTSYAPRGILSTLQGVAPR